MHLKAINAIQTPEDFDSILPLDTIQVSHRGGHVGFFGASLSSFLDIPINLLPGNAGAYCNYLGGGLRGSIQLSTYSSKITGRKKIILNALLNACKRVYINIETASGLTSETDDDGQTNWENTGTNACRAAGINSAY
jgi:hypothetical protein